VSTQSQPQPKSKTPLEKLDDLLLTSWIQACLGDLHRNEPAQDTYKAGFLRGIDWARHQLEQVKTAESA